jgi:hypothetical protein
VVRIPRLLRVGARARRFIRPMIKAAGAAAVVIAVRHVAGVWVAAGIAAFGAVVALIAALAALDSWASDRSRPAAAVVVHDGADSEALAHAFAVLAVAYLTACEQQESWR